MRLVVFKRMLLGRRLSAAGRYSLRYRWHASFCGWLHK